MSISDPPPLLSSASPSRRMPPHLHPRSRLTTSLFTTTLLASFLVVSIPHILPCPVNPHTEYAEGDMTEDGRRRRRRQRPKPAPETTSISPPTSVSSAEELSLDETVVDERLSMDRTRECPVPKPGGRVGKILGFRESAGDSQQPRRARIPVETRGRDSKIRDGNEGSGKEGKRIHEDEARPGG